MSWTTRAEAAIRALRDVDGATIQLEGDEIREIHVLTHSKRPAKQIVRDVQTVLMTLFNRSFDYRVVSVAYTKGEGGDGGRAHASGSDTAPAARTIEAP